MNLLITLHSTIQVSHHSAPCLGWGTNIPELRSVIDAACNSVLFTCFTYLLQGYRELLDMPVAAHAIAVQVPLLTLSITAYFLCFTRALRHLTQLQLK